MSYEDLKEHGSENAVKAAGKLRQQGKPYESVLRICDNGCLLTKFNCNVLLVIDGDIAYWKSGA
jgi:obg-like ATPase 1